MKIYQVDAFAKAIFRGNPAAVVPLDGWPPDALMQSIAAENNLSETAFFVRTESGAYQLRWFTPDYEIDLCGHATLASAFVIKNFVEPHLQSIRFSTKKAGELTVSVVGDRYTLDFPSRPPQPCAPHPSLLAALGTPPVVEVLRSRDYFVVLPSEEAVRNVEPDYTLLKAVDSIGVIVTAKGREFDAVSRCFYPGAGVPEDPVTGSAHCNIVPYWAEKLGKTSLRCEQASSRGGILDCELAGDRVRMTGACMLYMEGTLFLPPH